MPRPQRSRRWLHGLRRSCLARKLLRRAKPHRVLGCDEVHAPLRLSLRLEHGAQLVLASTCGFGGWGRISVDGPGQNNPDRSEGPRGRAGCAARMAVLNRTTCPTQSGTTGKVTRSTNGGCKLAHSDGHAGSRLNRSNVEEGTVGNASLEAVLGKTRRTEFWGGRRKRWHHSKPATRLRPTQPSKRPLFSTPSR
jgi:hypothetical protein